MFNFPERAEFIEDNLSALTRLSKEEIVNRKAEYKEKLLKRAKSLVKKAAKQNDYMKEQTENKALLGAIAFYLDEKRKARFYTKDTYNDDPRRRPKVYDKNKLEDILAKETPRYAIVEINGIASALKRRRKKPFHFMQGLVVRAASVFRFGTLQEKRIFKFGEDRVYYDVKIKAKSPLNITLEKLFEEHGMKLIDFKDGKVIKTPEFEGYKSGDEHNPIKLSKALYLIPGLKEKTRLFLKGEQDPIYWMRTKETDQHGYAIYSLIPAIMQAFETDYTRHDLMMVVSRNIDDIATMSTDRGWRSCMAYDGGYFDNALMAIKRGSLVAYLAKKDDFELKEPMSRSIIHPFQADILNNEEAGIKPTKAYSIINEGFKVADDFGSTKKQILGGLGKMLFGALLYPFNRAVYEATNLIGVSKQNNKRQSLLYASKTTYGMNGKVLECAGETWSKQLAQHHPVVKLAEEEVPNLRAKSFLYTDGAGFINGKNLKL